jgi:hypothetical protein
MKSFPVGPSLIPEVAGIEAKGARSVSPELMSEKAFVLHVETVIVKVSDTVTPPMNFQAFAIDPASYCETR